MDGVDRKALLKEFEFLTGLLEKHEASKKEEKQSVDQQKCKNLLPQKFRHQPTNLPYKFIKTSAQSLTSFDKKYSFKNPKSIVNQRTGLSNNLKSKHETSINQTSKCIKANFKRPVLNENNLCATKRTVTYSENKLEKSSIVSNKSEKIHSHIQLLEELECMTELLKKKNSENKLLNSVSKNRSDIQNKLSVYTNNKKNNYNECNKYKSLNSESIFSKTNCQTFSQKLTDGFASSLHNRALNRKCYTKLNSNNKNEPFAKLPLKKHFDINKYSYKKVASPVNSKVCCISTSLVGNDQFKKILSGSQVRKVTYSSSTNLQKSPSINPSVLAFKYLPSSKQNLVVKLNGNNDAVSSNSTLCKKSPTSMKVKSTFSKVKTPKSCKVSKLKSTSSSYVKINKHLITPNRSSQKSIFSTKKTRNMSSKYKVVNNTLPCANEKVLNLSNSSDSKKNSPILMDASDSFFQKLNDSAIEKLEQDLLAISTALTSTPLSSEVAVNNYKTHQHSRTKINATLNSKKMSLKKSRKRISKYKIINSDISHDVKKKNFLNLKSSFKNVKCPKFRSENKHLQPVHVLTPAKNGQSVLVKRLFKSKNTIINKNSTPINYRAKMIKSKYLALNKRKSPNWQNHLLYTQGTPVHKNIRGYYVSSKVPNLHNRYKTTALAYHPKVVRKFPNCNYSVNSQFRKSTSRSKLRKQLKNGFVNPPIVFIRGMRYSLNSSGKTLKKLPAKGQTTKTHKRIMYGKAFIRNPESLMKVSPTSSYIASRVLNRSISRIISASTKKSLTKVNTYCMFYNRFGRCNKGVKCTYIHDPSKIAVCTRFLRGTCKIDGCPFSHEIAPGKMAICSFFLVGACEKENCPYRHEKLLPDAELCKAFVQGYCPDGKECKKAHILICPKYIQGDCNKGSSCAYPHPPRKVKKNVLKEDEPEEKSDDLLLEKVSRYFLQTEDGLLGQNELDNAEKIFVPKQRKLEEQPSFIPLFQDSALSSTK